MEKSVQADLLVYVVEYHFNQNKKDFVTSRSAPAKVLSYSIKTAGSNSLRLILAFS